MPSLRFPLILCICLLGAAHAQMHGGSSFPVGTGNVHVHVVFDDDRKAGANILVRLMKGASSTPVETTYTNDAGQADFHWVPVGEYNVEVSGEGIDTMRSQPFDVDERKVTQSQYIIVRQSSQSKSQESVAPSVSAEDLNVPAKAQKEFHKASQALAEQDLKKALQHLQKAVAIAPRYVTAYNNLGVVYARMKDVPHELEALEKAVSLDEHFAPALLNLGRLCVLQKDFPKAETLLNRAVSVEPTNVESLMLLADSEFMDQHYDAAIGNADKAHSVASTHSAFVHYIAARAYQHENKPQEALSEFLVFLQEEPSGPRADYVRRDIGRMGTSARN